MLIIIGDIQFTLLYVPITYGPVQASKNKTIRGVSSDKKPARGGLADSEIMHEQTEVVAYNTAHPQEELDILKLKIANMERRIDNSVSQKWDCLNKSSSVLKRISQENLQ
ncbi:MAG: hypothetical protein E4H13_07105 [Calditrichales bacterium]|nr:MAG: hypothetical protein E4H13_07105 [Calditrichales bacterium]